jgi:hypothetical protein
MHAERNIFLESLWMCFATAVFIAATDRPTAAEYHDDGESAAAEEEIRWLVNRARFDSEAENAHRGTAYSDIPPSTGPLAAHHSLTTAARRHSEDLARSNLLQHETVPSSAYYDPVTQPKPWDRIEAEGYSWTGAGENIAAGYLSAGSAFQGWWNSEGHRKNMMGLGHREIGNGYYFWEASTYRHYYTMNLARAGSAHFFTCTIFQDVNRDGAYNAGEGVQGVRVRLRVNGSIHSQHDVSTSSGGFAIPINAIPAGSSVEVLLENISGRAVQLSVPVNWHRFTDVHLNAGDAHVAGAFVQSDDFRNFGFRDLIASPTLAIHRSSTDIEVTLHSVVGLQYTIQSSPDMVTWTNVITFPEPGTGAEISWIEFISPGGERMFYRVSVSRE